MLEKWLCHECERSWLVVKSDSAVGCPYCLTNGDHVEAVAEQNPDIDYHDEMGCLWPGYNEFDKLAYKVSRRKITQEQARDFLNAWLRGERP